jgi:hypothetical protein
MTETLAPADAETLRALAAVMVPADADLNVPAADDELIFADILRSIGRDLAAIRRALAALRDLAGTDPATLGAEAREALVQAYHAQGGPEVAALCRCVMQCYYRDDRVVRSLGLEVRPPFPKGRVLEQGDWSLLDAQRGRAPFWRDVDRP